MRRLIVICLLAAMIAYGLGFSPVAAFVGALALFFFVAFVRGHLDPKAPQSYGFVSKGA